MISTNLILSEPSICSQCREELPAETKVFFVKAGKAVKLHKGIRKEKLFSATILCPECLEFVNSKAAGRPTASYEEQNRVRETITPSWTAQPINPLRLP